jgi:hypothetical protein
MEQDLSARHHVVPAGCLVGLSPESSAFTSGDARGPRLLWAFCNLEWRTLHRPRAQPATHPGALSRDQHHSAKDRNGSANNPAHSLLVLSYHACTSTNTYWYKRQPSERPVSLSASWICPLPSRAMRASFRRRNASRRGIESQTITAACVRLGNPIAARLRPPSGRRTCASVLGKIPAEVLLPRRR